MDVSLFIARKIRFRGRIASVSIAVSFLIMIIAVAISSGFRYEIRNGVSSLSGDIQLTSSDMNWTGESSPIERHPSYYDRLLSIPGVTGIEPYVYRAGILKAGDNIHGVMLKGTASDTTLSRLGVSMPVRMASSLGLSAGDDVLIYFVGDGDKVKVRKFNIRSLYDSIIDSDDNLLIYASIDDLQRVNGWGRDSVSALEISLSPSYRSVRGITDASREAGAVALAFAAEEEASVIASSSVDRYAQLYDWLNLIDSNVFFILVLMTVVAGFNMISGLLIMLFENIPMIGTLKSMGMKDWTIARIFLRTSSSLVLKGMAAGNILALAFCGLQSATHLLKLDPENYFVSFVPVHINIGGIIAADLISYAVIMILLLVPALFISGVDPAKTMRVG